MPGRYLVIPDLQVPFEHQFALKFSKAVVKDFKIPLTNILCVGDEIDQVMGSRFPKDPDGHFTANQEIKESIKRLREWYKAFPHCRVAISNHGLRWAKRAFDAEIPSQMLRPYQELIEAPPGWKWAMEWRIKDTHPFRMVHGMGYSGMNGHRTAALDAGISTVIGHLHSHAGVSHIQTAGQHIWGMNSGSLIDESAYAFNYGRDSRWKSVAGCGVILGGGSTPLFIPLEAYL